MARFTLEVGFSTDVGRQRRRNEDSYAVFVPFPGEGNPSQLAGLMLVADGMGGERAGDRASQLTAERLRHWFSTGSYASWPEFSGDRALQAALTHAVRAVSNEIYQLGQHDPAIRGLGSTVVMAAMTSKHMILAHVGDSRCYMVRNGTIQQITSDHSWVQRQVDAGVITPEAARSHPQRNILTRSLGDSLPPEVDITTVDLRDGDLFVLCSDGLTNGLTDPEILDLCRLHTDPQTLSESLVRLANDKDGSDNITAVAGLCAAEGPQKARDFEDHTTSRIVVGDDEFYDGDTEVDIPRPSPEELYGQAGQEESSEVGWKTWLSAALLALALGLLAGYLVQRSHGSSIDPSGEYQGSTVRGAKISEAAAEDRLTRLPSSLEDRLV